MFARSQSLSADHGAGCAPVRRRSSSDSIERRKSACALCSFATSSSVSSGVAGSLLALALPSHDLRLVFAVFLALVAVRLVRDSLVTR